MPVYLQISFLLYGFVKAGRVYQSRICVPYSITIFNYRLLLVFNRTA